MCLWSQGGLEEVQSNNCKDDGFMKHRNSFCESCCSGPALFILKGGGQNKIFVKKLESSMNLLFELDLKECEILL